MPPKSQRSGGGRSGGRGRGRGRGRGSGGGGGGGGYRNTIFDTANLHAYNGSTARSPETTIKVVNNPLHEYLGQSLLECFYDPVKKHALRCLLWAISPMSMQNGWEVPQRTQGAMLTLQQLALAANPLAATQLQRQGQYGMHPFPQMVGSVPSISGSGSGHHLSLSSLPYPFPLPYPHSVPSLSIQVFQVLAYPV